MEKNQTRSALVVLTLSLFTLIVLASCAQQASIPDVTSMSLYEARQLLEQDIADAQVDFVTVKGTEVTVESGEHYSGWEIVAIEPSVGTAMTDGDDKEIQITIKMTNCNGSNFLDTKN